MSIENINDNYCSEYMLLDLLGYKLSQYSQNNKCLIWDCHTIVGHIKYMKLTRNNKKKKKKDIYGYQLEIDSLKYYVRRIRREHDNSYNYNINIKNNNSIDQLNIDLNPKNPHLSFYSKEYGFVIYEKRDNYIHFSYKSKTAHYNLEESITIDLNRLGQYFEYILNYNNSCKVNTISFEAGKCEDSNLFMKQSMFTNGKLKSTDSSIVNGSIEDVIDNHQLAVLSFDHFKYVLSHILPFDNEKLFELLGMNNIEDRIISLLSSNHHNKQYKKSN